MLQACPMHSVVMLGWTYWEKGGCTLADDGTLGLDFKSVADKRFVAHLHGVIDGQAGSDRAARAVNVDGDGFFRALRLEMQKLRHDGIGEVVAHLRK